MKISRSPKKHVEGLHYILNKNKSEIIKYCGDNAWMKLVIQLLGTCLDSGLVDYYDRYRNNNDVINSYRLIMFYLFFCRQYRIKPNNFIYRILRKTFPISNYFGFEQGSIL